MFNLFKKKDTKPDSTPPESTQPNAQQTEKKGLFASLSERLSRTRANIGSGFRSLFSGRNIDDDLYEELETQLLVADVGMTTTQNIIEHLTQHADKSALKDADALFVELKSYMAELLTNVEAPLDTQNTEGPFWSVATKELIGDNGVVKELVASRVEWKDGKMAEIPNSEFRIKADLVLLAMGFVSPQQSILEKFGVDKDARGNVKADTEGKKAYFTSRDKVFAAGDMRRGQSLVVWAIREGRQCAHAVDEYLMGNTSLPR